MEGWDPNTKSTLTQIPLLTTKAGPRDGAAWTQRLKEEYKALIAYTQMNKSNDNDWFRISAANPEGTRWIGKCWYIHNLLKYEFDLQFDIPVTYPSTAPELELPELDGKTQKVCVSIDFDCFEIFHSSTLKPNLTDVVDCFRCIEVVRSA
uniref:Ubiquitin-fold modifier-conjugating enzyme 1 n=1 Tax=Cucumis melo TaxID=3656 RepID=A0A9I9CH30_CUCME